MWLFYSNVKRIEDPDKAQLEEAVDSLDAVHRCFFHYSLDKQKSKYLVVAGGLSNFIVEYRDGPNASYYRCTDNKLNKENRLDLAIELLFIYMFNSKTNKKLLKQP